MQMVMHGSLPAGVYVGQEQRTAEVAMAEGGLGWDVAKEPTFVFDPNGNLQQRTGYYAIVRRTDRAVLGSVGRIYEPFQNREVFTFLDEALDRVGGRFHTVGQAQGGAVVWALAQLARRHEITRLDGRVDEHAHFLLARTSHDGYHPIDLSYLEFRLTCKNGMGHYGKTGHVAIRHTSKLAERVERARDFLLGATEWFDELAATEQRLAKERISRERFRDFAERLVLDVEDAIDRSKLSKQKVTRLDKTVGELEALFTNGSGNTGESAYDALNAVTEWVDHKRTAGVTAARRAMNGWFGPQAQIKTRALKLLAG
jgi:phage/plasmid-like protein (TIGR03299 family)